MYNWRILLGGAASAAILTVGVAAPALAQPVSPADTPTASLNGVSPDLGGSAAGGFVCHLPALPMSGPEVSAAAGATGQPCDSSPLPATASADSSSNDPTSGSSMVSGLSPVSAAIPDLGTASNAVPGMSKAAPMLPASGSAAAGTPAASTGSAGGSVPGLGSASVPGLGSGSGDTTGLGSVTGTVNGVTGSLPGANQVTSPLSGVGG